MENEEIVNNRPFYLVAAFFVAYAIAIAVIIMGFASCSPARKISRVMTAHPVEAAAVCSRMFPPVGSTRTEIKYLPGKTDTIPGPVVRVNCDSARAAAAGREDTLYVDVPCPPTTQRVDTIDRRDTTVLVDNAALFACEADKAGLATDLASQKTTTAWWRWIALAGWAFHLIPLIFKRLFPWLKTLFRVFPGGR